MMLQFHGWDAAEESTAHPAYPILVNSRYIVSVSGDGDAKKTRLVCRRGAFYLVESYEDVARLLESGKVAT